MGTPHWLIRINRSATAHLGGSFMKTNFAGVARLCCEELLPKLSFSAQLKQVPLDLNRGFPGAADRQNLSK